MARLFCAALVATLLFAGCDVFNDALNDALPEIGISDGLLGLGGEAGTEVTGSFSDGAGKAAGVTATAQFSVNKTFDDLESGDIQAIESLKTSVALMAALEGNASMVLDRGSAAALPDAITLEGASISWTLTDASASTSQQAQSTFTAVLTRASGCAATATACGYVLPAAVAIPLATFTLSEDRASEVFAIVGQTTPATPNTIVLTASLTVGNPVADLAGVTATISIGEFETTVQPVLF